MPYQSDIPQGAVRVRSTLILVLALAASVAQILDIAKAQEAHTLKERLSDKASDDQRVDNCHVAAERRGTRPRPNCPPDLRPSMPAAEAGQSSPKTQ
jgi:F0F1-type ATP synthase epsilon subunit